MINFLSVDMNNIIRCFYFKDGSEVLELKTENIFLKSNSKFSMLIKE